MSITWLVRNSFFLDWSFLIISPWPVQKKIRFLITKYFLITKHLLFPFKLGQSQTNFFGQSIYYDVPFGIAGYQSMMSRHQLLFQLGNLKKIKKVIDVGANVGFFSMLIRDIFPRSQVYALEPVPLTFECLKNNFIGDKRTFPFKIGVSKKNVLANMEFNPNLSAVSSISPKGKIKVKLVTLDAFIKKHRIEEIDLLKIDTEGYELHVLEGAKKALAKTRYIHLEVTLEDNDNYTFSQLLSQLYSSKYNFQLLAYRSYTDKSIGKATVFDLLLKNIHLK